MEHAEIGSGRDTNRSTGIIGRVRDSAATQLSQQKDRATDGLGSVAQAVRQSTHKLREQQHDTIARYVDEAADQLERFSSRLREKNVNELVGEAQRFARQRPALFIGSAFALGLLGARFLKSTADRDARARGYGAVPRQLPGSGYRDPSYRPGTTGGADIPRSRFGGTEIR